MIHVLEAAMDKKTIKLELIHWLTELQDTEILKILQKLKETGEGKLTKAQQKDLQERLNRYDAGELTFIDWKDAKEKIRDKGKDAL